MLRRVDYRFVLPRPVHTAAALAAPEAERALAEAGVELVALGAGSPPDLVVATSAAVVGAAAAGAEHAVVEGRRARRALARSYTNVRRFLPLPSLDDPQLLVPLDEPQAAAYALQSWTPPGAGWRGLRNSLAAALLARRALPELRPVVSVATHDGRPPFILAAARDLGIPDGAAWFLAPGFGDALSRALFHVFERGADRPSWVVKFARVRGYREPFERDERGLRVAADAGPVAAAHTPKLLGAFAVDGHHASVETAAVGRRLTDILRSRADRERKLRLVDDVAGWIVELGSQTKATSDALAAERTRLAEAVLPGWVSSGVPADLVERIAGVPAVLQHNDLGTWNVIVHERGFTAVDWESARRHGLPLWDLVYFLTAALPEVELATADADERDAQAARLLRGESPLSETVFRWTRTAAEALALAPEAVAPLVTLGWLHHGLSHVARADAVERHDAGARHTGTFGERMARVWSSDPALGPRWDAWRR